MKSSKRRYEPISFEYFNECGKFSFSEFATFQLNLNRFGGLKEMLFFGRLKTTLVKCFFIGVIFQFAINQNTIAMSAANPKQLADLRILYNSVISAHGITTANDPFYKSVFHLCMQSLMTDGVEEYMAGCACNMLIDLKTNSSLAHKCTITQYVDYFNDLGLTASSNSKDIIDALNESTMTKKKCIGGFEKYTRLVSRASWNDYYGMKGKASVTKATDKYPDGTLKPHTPIKINSRQIKKRGWAYNNYITSLRTGSRPNKPEKTATVWVTPHEKCCTLISVFATANRSSFSDTENEDSECLKFACNTIGWPRFVDPKKLPAESLGKFEMIQVVYPVDFHSRCDVYQPIAMSQRYDETVLFINHDGSLNDHGLTWFPRHPQGALERIHHNYYEHVGFTAHMFGGTKDFEPKPFDTTGYLAEALKRLI